MLRNHGHTGPALHQGFALCFSGNELLGKDSGLRQAAVEGEGLLQVDLSAGGPLGQNLLAQLHKLIFRDFLILNLHLPLSPFS